MKKASKQKFYELQYQAGETKGPLWYQWLQPWVKDREQIALELLNGSLDNKIVVDVGCGEGHLLNRMRHEIKEGIGLDIASNRLELARKKNTSFKNLCFKQCDIDDTIPLESATVDVVICLSVLEYAYDPYFTMGEITRILKPGGLLVLSVPNIAYLTERIKLLFGVLPSWPDAPGWQGGRLHAFTQHSMHELLNSYGIRIKHSQGSGFLAKLRSFHCSVLCGDILILGTKI